MIIWVRFNSIIIFQQKANDNSQLPSRQVRSFVLPQPSGILWFASSECHQCLSSSTVGNLPESTSLSILYTAAHLPYPPAKLPSQRGHFPRNATGISKAANTCAGTCLKTAHQKKLKKGTKTLKLNSQPSFRLRRTNSNLQDQF